MDHEEKTARLREIAGRFGEVPTGNGFFAHLLEPFDTTKPNLHDSKAEFLAEKNAVESARTDLMGVLEFLMSAYKDEKEIDPIARRLCDVVDSKARERKRDDNPESVAAMINRNAVEYRLTYTTIFLLIDLLSELNERNKELENQGAAFWSLKSRAPDYFARTIALRFAKLVARMTGKKPTFGSSRDGGHPSTEFGRALEEVFQVLGIQTNVRHPAKWAIAQLTEDDLKPPENKPLGSLFGLGAKTPPPINRLTSISDVLSKGLTE